MKPFWGMDLTYDKDNEGLNDELFLVAKPDPALQEALDRATEQAEGAVSPAELPPVLNVLRWVSGAVGALGLVGISRGLSRNDGLSMADAYHNAPWLFWAAGVCALLWFSLTLVARKRFRDLKQSDEGQQLLSHVDMAEQAIMTQFGVPATAVGVDILSFYYKVDGEQIKVCEKPMQLFSHFNCAFKAYADATDLYLVSDYAKYRFPLAGMTAIRTNKSKVRLHEWNKDVPFSDDVYQPYKMVADKFGCVHVKPHHVLELEQDGETFGIYFPAYELPTFEQLTGLRATQD